MEPQAVVRVHLDHVGKLGQSQQPNDRQRLDLGEPLGQIQDQIKILHRSQKQADRIHSQRRTPQNEGQNSGCHHQC